MKKIVVFTGAGVSADSGLATFRDSDGLWANYRIEDVCTPEALRDNRAQVVDFYNMRRREMLGKEPNAGHRAIAGLEKCFDVEVITQNVDNLHERAGSSRVTHLHGELTKLRSSRDPELIVPIDGWEQRLDANRSGRLPASPSYRLFRRGGPDVRTGGRDRRDSRSHGRSRVLRWAVYPAASLVRYVRPDVPIFLVDPGNPDTAMIRNPLTHIRSRAAEGMPELAERLKSEFS